MKKITIAITVLLLLLGVIVLVSAQDLCWVENFEDIDYTVCEVEGGIYVLTPTPAPTQKPPPKSIQETVGSIFGGSEPINNFLPGWAWSIFGGPEPINDFLPDWVE